MGMGGASKHVGRREGKAASSGLEGPGETRACRRVWLVIACMAFLTLVFVSRAYRPPLVLIAGDASQQQQQQPIDDDFSTVAPDVNEVFYGPSSTPGVEYLGGLLAAGFDESTCLSRYQSTMYRKPSPHKPSPHLVRRLRQYEEHHRRCAPHTAAYKKALELLKPGKMTSPAPEKETECKYIVWIPWGGLGNRMMTLASTFLYALLTDRVVLVDGRGKDLAGLFCEPFPATTWLLPQDFPIADFSPFGRRHPKSYGNLLKEEKISTADTGGRPPPSFVYVHLDDDYTTDDMHFFCEPDQKVLRRVPWTLLRSDNYFVPGLFLNRDFERELGRLFPEKETVFHHLSRYLFHPTNKVWGMITRYYRAYLATAGETVGIQIRVFSSKDAPFEVVSEQVINCTIKEKLLPEVELKDRTSISSMADEPSKRKAVVLTSLYSGYYDRIKNMYWEHPAAGGVVVSVHQSSHEEKQQTDEAGHDAKAWAEMNLLGFADVLVTSAWSTFGYVAQGLGGVRPWVLLRPEKGVMPEPTCVRDISMEPCFHSPPSWVCREKKFGDNGKVVPFVTHCRDVSGGLKLVDPIQ